MRDQRADLSEIEVKRIGISGAKPGWSQVLLKPLTTYLRGFSAIPRPDSEEVRLNTLVQRAGRLEAGGVILRLDVEAGGEGEVAEEEKRATVVA